MELMTILHYYLLTNIFPTLKQATKNRMVDLASVLKTTKEQRLTRGVYIRDGKRLTRGVYIRDGRLNESTINSSRSSCLVMHTTIKQRRFSSKSWHIHFVFFL